VSAADTDFFAIGLLPDSVDHRQHNRRVGIDTGRPDRVPAPLSGFVYAVQTHQTALVFENQRRHLE